MTTLPNIAFIGKAGSGKTTCRQILEQQYGYQRHSWAAPLKVGCGTTTDRGLLQRVGQGVRDLHEDFWVNLGLAELDACAAGDRHVLAAHHPFVNDDTRYPNEAAALKGRGFTIVRVVAPRSLRVDRLKRNGRMQDEAQLGHESETALDSFEADHRIINDGWPEDLAATMEHIVNLYRS